MSCDGLELARCRAGRVACLFFVLGIFFFLKSPGILQDNPRQPEASPEIININYISEGAFLLYDFRL